MWPSKEGLGVQLSYGVNGNGIVVSKETSSNNGEICKRLPHLQFPRKRNLGIALNKVGKSSITLVNQQTSLFDLNSRVYDNLKNTVINQPSQPKRKMYSDTNIYVPDEILKSYVIESKSLTSTIAYDPTYGQLFTIFDIRSRNGSSTCKAMAYVTGETGTILNISVLQYQEKELTDNKHEMTGIRALIPVLADPFQVALSEPIKQIEPCKLKECFDYIPSYLLVRTDCKIHVLNCYKGTSQYTNSNIELDIIGELTTSDIMGHIFADITFNPWASTQFGVVDVKGNFAIWDINTKKDSRTKIKKLVLKQKKMMDSDTFQEIDPSIYEVTELSNWKKITWSHDYNHIFVISRSSLTQFTLNPELESQKLITSDTWSRIQDIYKNPNDMEYAFILTSKELIWFKLSYPLQRLMSWKHFLDDNDPSLRLQVTEYDDGRGFLCLIYSQISPVIFVYNFGIRDGMPYSLKDPYYIRRGNEKSNNKNSLLQQVLLAELNMELYTPSKEFQDKPMNEDEDKHILTGLFEMSTDLGLKLSVFAENPGLLLGKPSFKNSFADNSSSYDSSASFEYDMVKTKSTFFKSFSKTDFEQIAKSLCSMTNINGEDEIKLVQEYAFKLGEGASRINKDKNRLDSSNYEHSNLDPSFLSIIDISDELPFTINDISEFDSMVEQLSNFYNVKDITISNMIKKTFETSQLFGKLQNPSKNVYSINDILLTLQQTYATKDLQKFNPDSILKKISLLIGASLMKAKFNELDKYYSGKVDNAMNNTSKHIQDILKEWDNEEYDNNNEALTRVDNFGSQATVPDIITSSMPSIKITSQNKSTPSQSKKSKHHSKLRHKALKQQSSQVEYDPSPLSQIYVSQPAESDPNESTTPSVQLSQESSSSSQLLPPTARISSQFSQKRFKPSQNSQRKVKKKRKSGFA